MVRNSRRTGRFIPAVPFFYDRITYTLRPDIDAVVRFFRKRRAVDPVGNPVVLPCDVLAREHIASIGERGYRQSSLGGRFNDEFFCLV